MAQVQSSRAKIYRDNASVADEPTQHVESAGEKLIKEMVQKQMNTKVDLHNELQHEKKFEKASEFVPLTNLTCGKISLKDFEITANKASHVEDLKSFDLTEDEIEMALDFEKGDTFFTKKYSKVEDSILSSRLLLIHSKIENGQKRLHEAVKERITGLSRHECELGLSVKPNSQHTRLLQFALSCTPSSTDPRPEGHPIHHLKELEQELFGHMHSKPAMRKRMRKPSPEIEDIYYNYKKSSTLWDLKEKPECSKEENNKKCKEKKPNLRMYSCKPQILYTIKDKKIVPLDAIPKPQKTGKCKEMLPCRGQSFVVSDKPQEIISLDFISRNRLSLSEIKKLPRFETYEIGNPSTVLYIKNLSSSAQETDLVSVFSNFESGAEKRLVYRLMTGRMRGQAFITFPTIETASEALQTVNGFSLKSKPMIIQYGREGS